MAIILKEEEQVLNYENQPEIKRNLLQNLFELTKDQYDTLMAAIESIPEDYTQALADIQALQAQVEELTTQLENKADVTGSYPGMSVGASETIISDEAVETNSVPYTFRPVPFDSTRKEVEVVGGSVAWNQTYVKGYSQTPGEYGGVTITVNDDGSLTLNGTCSANATFVVHSGIAHTEGHKYLVSGWRQVGSNTGYLGIGGTKVDGGNGGIITGTSSTWNLRIDVHAGDVYTNTKIYPLFTDLTQMLGSTIADYINTLETTTAGAGVAKLKEWGFFRKPYYPYSAPTIESVQVGGQVCVGFNQWDEETANGYWDGTTGDFVSSNSWMASKNYIPCLPNTEYYFKLTQPSSGSWGGLRLYTSDKQFIGSGTITANKVTTPANAYYMTFYADKAWFDSPICINISDANKNGTYEPYDAHTYPLDSSLTIRGIPKLTDGVLSYDGDVYKADGSVTRKYGIIVLDGTQTIAIDNWRAGENGVGWIYSYGTTNNEVPAANETPNVKSDKLITLSYDSAYVQNVGIALFNSNAYGLVVWQNDTSLTSAGAINAYLANNPITVVYPLATPTTETAEPFAPIMTISPGGTEEWIDAGERDVAIPVGHNTKYYIDLVDKLVALPSAAAADGLYLIKQTSGKMSLESYPPEESAGTDDVPASPDVVIERPDDLTIQPIDLTEREDFTPIEEWKPLETDIEMIPDDDEPEPVLTFDNAEDEDPEEPAKNEEPEEPAEDE